MGFLAPLYIAGLAAIGLPILFHLIRRTPSGRQSFSSLMFLSPSPPRLTKRSRLNNLILLLLRAAAICLLALAFARPFLQNDADANITPTRGRRIALLVDTSASMRRADLWQQTIAQVDQILSDVSNADEVALYAFDRHPRPAMTFAEWKELEPSRRVPVLKARLADTKLTWAGTKLGEAVATVADVVGETETANDRALDKKIRQIVLISDMQQGSHAESLQGYQWPENVTLEVKQVAPKQPSNAGLQIVKQSADADEKKAGVLRVRVSNEPGSTREQYSLAWANQRGRIAATQPVTTYVPPGRSQVVRVPWPAPGDKADRLILSGDDFDFDNTLFVSARPSETVRMLYLGDDAADDVKGLNYYLQSATADTALRKIDRITRRSTEPLTEADLTGTRLVVATESLSDDRGTKLRRFVENGGELLWVLKDVAAAQSLGFFLQADALTVDESPPRDFSLIGKVDLEHPLFSAFADARFADFTKIHFWRHRRVTLPEKTADLRVVAWFDDGDPFLLVKQIGKGRAVIATSGWQPTDSQLALSTKFVPLIDGVIHRRDGDMAEAQYSIDDPITLPKNIAGASRAMIDPSGKRTEIDAKALTFDGADQPGIYRLMTGDQETPIAVNLSPEESRTAPLPVEELERWGAKLASAAGAATPQETAAIQRRLRLGELENKQKLWRWLIVGVLGLLAAETALAGWLARRTVAQQATT